MRAVSWKRGELAAKAPGLDWPALLDAAGLEDAPVFIIWHPKAVPGLSALAAGEPLEAWKDWLAFHAIERAAAFLPKAFVDERFSFYGKALSGIPELRPRWQRGMDYTSAALGEAVGKLYVQRYFPAATKAKAQAMVGDLVRAFAKRIDALTWMSPETKTKAKQKLDTLKVGVGYPDRWQDYSRLEVVKGDALGNAQRAELFEYRHQLDKLRQPVDRDEWWMTPQTVNAVNLPLQNALNFPAAIIQPPYFDPQADAAHNYGSMGAIIGHEISHSFDDQGSQFDAAGRLANWWTKEDFDHFKAAGEALAAQFDALPAFSGSGGEWSSDAQRKHRRRGRSPGRLRRVPALARREAGRGQRRLQRRSAVLHQLRAKLAVQDARCGNAEADRHRRPCPRSSTAPTPCGTWTPGTMLSRRIFRRSCTWRRRTGCGYGSGIPTGWRVAARDAVRESVGRRKRLPHKDGSPSTALWDRRFRLSIRRPTRLFHAFAHHGAPFSDSGRVVNLVNPLRDVILLHGKGTCSQGRNTSAATPCRGVSRRNSHTGATAKWRGRKMAPWSRVQGSLQPH